MGRGGISPPKILKGKQKGIPPFSFPIIDIRTRDR
jgi:hypothetical protein